MLPVRPAEIRGIPGRHPATAICGPRGRRTADGSRSRRNTIRFPASRRAYMIILLVVGDRMTLRQNGADPIVVERVGGDLDRVQRQDGLRQSRQQPVGVSIGRQNDGSGTDPMATGSQGPALTGSVHRRHKGIAEYPCAGALRGGRQPADQLDRLHRAASGRQGTRPIGRRTGQAVQVRTLDEFEARPEFVPGTGPPTAPYRAPPGNGRPAASHPAGHRSRSRSAAPDRTAHRPS